MGVFYKIRRKIGILIIGKKPNEKPQIERFQELGLVKIGNNSNITNINIQIRKSDAIKLYLALGNDSVVGGTFVFENENGRIDVGDRTFIGGASKFISINNISIGNDVLISWGCTFMDNNAHSLKWSERKDDVREWKKGIEENKVGYYKNWNNVKSSPIIIENKVWIGFEVVVLKGVKIGEGAIIASRSIVTKDVPDWTIVAGNPAQIVREIPENER
jgi:acetyltransferase-like isoleucine patch superfamily enzyme